MNKNYALVTGASAGIGKAIAKELADRGYNLVLTARREDRLIQLAKMLEKNHGVKAEFISADLSDLSSCSKIFNFCKSNQLHVDFLVNNAGYGINKKFHETTVKAEVDFINVLSTSVISLTKMFIPDMLKRGSGKIMIVSSIAAFMPPTEYTSILYGPVKTFMNRFVEEMNARYKKHGISATAICPGLTVTEFHEASGAQEFMDKAPSFLKMDPSVVAKGAVEATLNGKRIWVSGFINKVLTVIFKLTPNRLFIRRATYLGKK